MALDAPPEALSWGAGVFSAGEDTERSRTIADIAMYAHGTGALPSGVEGGLDAQTVYRD
jgi:carbon-monoxide dehydrogenase large subunit